MSPAGPPAPKGAALRALASVAAVLAAGLLWTALSRPPSAFALVENSLLRASLVGIVVAFAQGRRDVARCFGPTDRRQAFALGAVVAGALAVRCSVEALPFHAYNWLECLSARVDPEPVPWWYANGYGVFMRIPMTFGLGVEDAIFTGNRAAGVLSCLALYVFDRVLFGDERKALWSSAFLAFLPLHVRLSASETMQLLPSLFQLVALAGVVVHARTGSLPALVAGMLAVFYASLSRPEGIFVLLVLPLVYLLPGAWRRLFRPSSLAVIVAGVVVLAPLFFDGSFQKFRHETPDHYLTPFRLSLEHTWTALQSSGVEASTLGAGAVLGLAILVLRHQLRALPLLAAPLCLLALLIEIAGFDANSANRWQLLIPALPLLALLASAFPALAGDLITRLAGRTAARAVLALVGAVFLASTRGALLYHYLGDQQQEYRFLHAHRALLRTLGPRLPLVRPHFDSEDGPFAVFPIYDLPPGVRVYTRADLLAGHVPLPAIWYQGLSCARPTPLADPHPLPRGHCADVEENFILEPIATARLDGPVFAQPDVELTAEELWTPTAPDRAPVVGFYRVVGRRAPTPR